MHDETPLAPIRPEEIAILIDDEKLRGDLGGEPPFPFRHDWLRGADDADRGVVAGLQLVEQTDPARWFGVIRYARDGSTKTLGDSGEAGDEIDLHCVAIDLIEFGDQRIEQMARAALDQQDPGQRRNFAAEEVAHNARMAR